MRQPHVLADHDSEVLNRELLHRRLPKAVTGLHEVRAELRFVEPYSLQFFQRGARHLEFLITESIDQLRASESLPLADGAVNPSHDSTRPDPWMDSLDRY